jgi:hypothetical protein
MEDQAYWSQRNGFMGSGHHCEPEANRGWEIAGEELAISDRGTGQRSRREAYPRKARQRLQEDAKVSSDLMSRPPVAY